MGNYIDAAYIIKRTDETELEEVLATSDVTTSDVLLQAIIDAEAFVDESLESIYTVPLVTPSATIKDVAYFIAQYKMYSYRYQATMPDTVVTDYKWALQYLKDVAAEKIKILGQTESTDIGTTIITNKDSDDKYFDSDKLAQML